MNALRTLMERFDRIFRFPVAYAHCDVPCGIYDPYAAQVAAHTVVRMDMLIADVMKSGGATAEDRNKMVRYVSVKEQHAEIVKHEVTVIWGDYMKPEHAAAHPELQELVWSTLKLAGKAKQSADIKDAEALLESVQKFAEVFWLTKNVPTTRAKSFYPTERTMVYPKV
ncbi:MAG: superoxide dismutase, Ni [Candidatus Micrarchaeaceae archaeon]